MQSLYLFVSIRFGRKEKEKRGLTCILVKYECFLVVQDKVVLENQNQDEFYDGGGHLPDDILTTSVAFGSSVPF